MPDVDQTVLKDARKKKGKLHPSYAKYLHTEKSRKNIDSCGKVNHVHVFILMGLITEEKKSVQAVIIIKCCLDKRPLMS